jgi:15-cis-phytoene desaturase
MSDVMIDPLIDYLKGCGITFESNNPVTTINHRGNNWELVTKQKKYSCQNVVLASTINVTQELLRPYQKNLPSLTQFFSLPSYPAVTLQIELDKRTMNVDRTEFGPLTSMSSFSEQSYTTFQQSGGRLSVILSDPRKNLLVKDKQLLDMVLTDARRLGLAIGKVKNYRKISHEHDFYLLGPGMEAKRPLQKTDLSGMYLAGDYTKQNFFATMEGAVISGRLAAEQLIASA